jgi:ATP-dependent Clp protease ATP-binding subunit ClpE
MLADNHLHVTVSDAAKSRLVALGYDPKMGARPLRRVLQEQIEDQVADVYLDNPEVTHLTADVNDADQIIVTAETSAVAVETPSS